MSKTFFLTYPNGDRLPIDFCGETIQELFDQAWTETGREIESLVVQNETGLFVFEGISDSLTRCNDLPDGSILYLRFKTPCDDPSRRTTSLHQAAPRANARAMQAIIDETMDVEPRLSLVSSESSTNELEEETRGDYSDNTLEMIECVAPLLERRERNMKRENEIKGREKERDEKRRSRREKTQVQSIDELDWANRTALLIASKHHNLPGASVLIANGANVNALNPVPLFSRVHETALYGCLKSLVLPEKVGWKTSLSSSGMDLLRHLISCGANLNLRCGIDQETVLHLASRTGHPGIVHMLEDAGADRSIRNLQGKTAAEVEYNPTLS